MLPQKKQCIVHLQAIKTSLSALKPQVHQAINAISVEHDLIKDKTTEFNECFSVQIETYHQAKAKLKELEMSSQRRDENIKVLNDQLEQLSMELADVKKQIHDKGKSMTDTTPLVEMRAATQRLKEENKDLDIRIGVFYHELTQVRKGEGNFKRSEGEESDDDMQRN
jgi:intraflagellar transport protein 57